MVSLNPSPNPKADGRLKPLQTLLRPLHRDVPPYPPVFCLRYPALFLSKASYEGQLICRRLRS